jgi:threonine aldolase
MSKDTYSAMAQNSPLSGANVIDLRSDTVTRPGEGMREAMVNAHLGDDVYGEDPTVIALEQQTASLVGKQAGLFVSSGTQGNLLAMLVHCQRGEEYIAGDIYHSFAEEGGGASALGGIAAYPLPLDKNNALSVDRVRAAIKPDDQHYPITRLLCLENTVHGKVQPTAHINDLSDVAHAAELKVHLDGARLMNAAVALSQPVSELAASADSVSICLSKGLGAPVGSVLLGSEPFIKRARRLRKMLGGGTRQAGVLAACGLYALEHNIDRLTEDHANAKRLAEGLNAVDGLSVYNATNMVFMRMDEALISPLADYLAQRNILISRQVPEVRLVTHLDISRDDIETMLKALADYMAAR